MGWRGRECRDPGVSCLAVAALCMRSTGVNIHVGVGDPNNCLEMMFSLHGSLVNGEYNERGTRRHRQTGSQAVIIAPERKQWACSKAEAQGERRRLHLRGVQWAD